MSSGRTLGTGWDRGIMDLVAPLVGAASQLGGKVALVGGAVRDLLLCQRPPELDLVFLGEPAAFRQVLERVCSEAGWVLSRAHDRFGTASLVEPEKGMRVDLAMARRETYPAPGALPVVSVGARLEEDLARRDFTINSMAVPLPGNQLLDPFDGAADLAGRCLRLLHSGSILDDPTRALRAAKYAARLDFFPESVIFSEAMDRSRAARAWSAISADRLRAALAGVLAEPGWRTGASRILVPWKILDLIAGRPVQLSLPPPGTGPASWPDLLGLLDPESRQALGSRLSLAKRVVRRASCK
ncbi:MAG: CCA tRNA nucleotidyltransferase [Acidobacteria bacterium]|nr:CCA tRNA nucleotidyltransferase [Acidobacteriota bacterium]